MQNKHSALKIVGILVGAVAIIFGVLLAVLLTWDWDRSRPWLNDKVSLAIARDFQIRGHITVGWHREPGERGWRSFVPWPRFTANDVVIKNPAWAQKPEFATIEQIRFDMNLLPLFGKQIDIPTIALVNPSVDLERMADGRVNWVLKTKSDQRSRWHVNIDEVAFAAGQISLEDQIKKINAHAEIRPVGSAIQLGSLLDKSARAASGSAASMSATSVPAASGSAASAASASASASASTSSKSAASASAAASMKQAATPTRDAPAASSANTAAPADPSLYGFAFTVAGTHDKFPLHGSGQFGGVLSLVNASKPFPLQVDLHVGDNHIAVVGTITDPAKIGALDLQLQLASNSMAHLYELTGITLPETPPFRTRGHLTGTLQKGQNVFDYEKFTGHVGGSDLSGSLRYQTGGTRPKLSGDLRSEKLLFADLAPLIGAHTAKDSAKGTHPEVKEIPGHAIPATRFRTERWKSMDADVKFVGKQIIRPAALPVNDVSTHLKMDDGVLSLNPLKFGVAGGTLSGNIQLNGRATPLHGKFSLAARGMRLKQLFPTFEPMQTSFGQINGDADLAAVGNDPAALASSLNGEIKLLLNDGAISNALLEKAGLNVANIVMAKLFGDKTVKINCAAADFVVTKGVLNSRVFALDTTDALINVDGTVNLGSEALDLNVYPHTKGFRIFSLRSPLYVKGTFKQPHVGVAVGPLAARGAAAVGLGLLNPFAALAALIVPSNNSASPCPAIIADANKGLRAAPHK